MTLLDAVTDALRTKMRNDERLVVFSEDVGKTRGVLLGTQGLQHQIGVER